MPTLLHINGFRFYFFSHEPNEPPHVHVDKAGATAKIWLADLSVAKARGFRDREIAGITKIVDERRAEFLEAWHEYFS